MATTNYISIPLFMLKDGEYKPVNLLHDPAQVHAAKCTICGKTYLNQYQATNCCNDKKTKACIVCGQTLPLREYDDRCKDCKEKYKKEKEKETFKKAQKVEYTGQVVIIYNSDHFIFDENELDDWLNDLFSEKDFNFDNYDYRLFVCKEEKWAGIDHRDILEREFEEWYEGAEDTITDRKGLEEFLTTWNAKQDVKQYHEEHKQYVDLTDYAKELYKEYLDNVKDE